MRLLVLLDAMSKDFCNNVETTNDKLIQLCGIKDSIIINKDSLYNGCNELILLCQEQNKQKDEINKKTKRQNVFLKILSGVLLALNFVN